MSSDYAVKKANHREQMAILDRNQKGQVREKNSKHKAEMGELRNRHGINKQGLQNNQKNQLETLKQQNDTFVQKERLNHNAKIDKQNLQAQKDYQRAAGKKQQQNARLKQTTEIEKNNYVQTREQYRQMTQDKKSISEKQLQQMDDQGKFLVRQKRAQNTEREESLQKQHTKEVNRIEQHGQKSVKQRRAKYFNDEKMQTEAHQHNIEKNKQDFQGVKKRQHNYYHKKLDEDEQFFQDQIKSQRKEYTGRYNENNKFNRASFANQQNRYQEEIFGLKRDFVSTANFYEDRKQDPFYSLVDFNADFKEGEAFYEVTAKIPEHEMKNVRVHIQPEKISLQATRQHEQEFKNKNEKIGSNIAQTIRQEFEFSKPAEHEAAVKTFKDGILTVTIPKQGYYDFGSKV